MYLPMHENVNYAQDLLISAPENPVYKLAITFNLKLRRLWHEQGTATLTPFPAISRAFPGHFLAP